MMMMMMMMVTAQRQRRNGIFHVWNVILTALTEFLWNFRNCNGRTATERWKPGITLYSTALMVKLKIVNKW